MVPKYPKTFHWPWSPAPHRKYHATPETLTHRRVIITEKLDGGNTAMKDGKVYSRSTGQPATEPWFDIIKGNHAMMTFGQKPVIYGENLYAVHSIEYDPLPNFYHVFHLLDEETMTFRAWDAVVEFCEQIGFMHVPVVFDGVFDSVNGLTDFLHTNLKLPSVYGPDREGFVVRAADPIPYDYYATLTTKFVRAKHIKTDVHWTKTWYPAKLKETA